MAKKILVIDDDVSTRLILKAMLEKDYILLFAKNGMEGLEFVASDPDIDIILTDIFMPILDGFALTEYIRKQKEPFNQLPIIIMSGQNTKENAQKAEKAKANAWIGKPLTREKVLGLLKKVAA